VENLKDRAISACSAHALCQTASQVHWNAWEVLLPISE